MVKKQFDIAIIDYGINNLFSVKRACDLLGLKSIITSEHDKIISSRSVILPGVGAFPYAMNNLKKMKLDNSILDFIETGRPLMGVCLGMQLLMESSIEFEKVKGLGIIKGTTDKFKYNFFNEDNYYVPHVGWNRIYKENKNWNNTVLERINDGDFMYFVHSYFVKPYEDVSLAQTTYGQTKYCSAFQKENVIGVQFHPEKSGNLGFDIYKKFMEMINP